MRKFVAYALCTAGMIGVYFLVRFIVTGISPDFGLGFVMGGFTIALLLWAAERIDRSALRSRSRKL